MYWEDSFDLGMFFWVAWTPAHTVFLKAAQTQAILRSSAELFSAMSAREDRGHIRELFTCIHLEKREDRYVSFSPVFI